MEDKLAARKKQWNDTLEFGLRREKAMSSMYWNWIKVALGACLED
jgi:hypothetical protein